MAGQSASTHAHSANSKGGRKKMDKNNNNNSDERIKKLTRRLNRKVRRIAKLEQRELERHNQYSLQVAFLQEKLNIKNKKIGQLKKENRGRNKLAIENERLRKEIVENANSTACKDPNRLVNQSRSVSHRIQEVIEEIENRFANDESQPPCDREIKVTVLEILRTANWDTTTLKNLIQMTAAKYSQFDLSAKKDFIKSIVRTAASKRDN